jgi:hypothetical protein
MALFNNSFSRISQFKDSSLEEQVTASNLATGQIWKFNVLLQNIEKMRNSGKQGIVAHLS